MEKNCYDKGCKNSCIIEVIFSILVGVIVGYLFSVSLVPVALNFIKVALVASAMGIYVLGASIFAANALKHCNIFRKCLCRINICLLVSAIGTLIAGTFTATAGLVTTSIASILGVGFTVFFFVWLILSMISLFSCLIKSTCKRVED